MKTKTSRIIKAFAALFAFAFAGAAQADTWTDPGTGITWTYRVAGGEAEIYNSGKAAIPTNTVGAADVPSTLGGYPVTRIGNDAFENCWLLTRVKIPSGVTSIGDYVVHSAVSLRDLSIPKTVTTLGGNTFLANSVKYIHVEEGDTARVSALVSASAPYVSVPYIEGFPANDDFAGATEISGLSGSENGSNAGATTEADEPLVAHFSDGTAAPGSTVWWTWTAPGNCLVIMDTLGSDSDTLLGVYTGNALGALTVVAENDNDLSLSSSTKSRVYFNAVAGQTYRIAVGGHQYFETGAITLNWAAYAVPDYAAILGAPAGMAFTAGGAKPWIDGGTVGGKAAVRSGLETTDNSKVSSLTATFSGAGTLSFWYKVSSEEGFDQLEFFMDGGGNCLAGTYKNSGTVDWTKYEYELGAGDHTVVWKYSKDSSTSSGDDCAWIADVSFVAPATKYTVTFDKNGGDSVSEASREVDEGDPVGSPLPTASRSGYTFDGWFTAATGGTKIDGTETVTADVTYYAQWTENAPAPGPDPEPGPEPSPEPGPDPDPGYVVINPEDVKEPYAAPKAVTLYGAVYDGKAVTGIVELKLGKVNAGKGTSKISGNVTGLDGKKKTIKANTVSGIAGVSPVTVVLEVKELGAMEVTIGGDVFSGTLTGSQGAFHVQSANVGGAWAGSTATVSVEVGDTSAFPGVMLDALLPVEEVATASGGKWTFKKAAGVKWAKIKDGDPIPAIYDAESKKGLVIDISKDKTNLSGMKLTYTPKKGTFKGSFKGYALEGAGAKIKLKKYTFNVTGVVVDGKGYGSAISKKPAADWSVTVK